MAKSQSSIEAALLISFMMLVLVVFMLAVTGRIVDIQEKRDKELLQDIGFVIANEFKIAAAAENGYQRTFSVPDTIKGKNFSIVLVDSATMGTNFSELTLKYINQTLYFEDAIILPVNIRGSVYKGQNLLVKKKGVVYITEVFPACGDSIIESGEQCDDGNSVNGDGCSSTCRNEG